MRKLAVVTVGRSDYGIYLPILRLIQNNPDLQLLLIAGGMHLSPAHGMTINMLEADGFIPAARIEMTSTKDSPRDIAHAIGLGILGFSDALERLAPDLLVVLGDRYEMFAAALSALPFKIPVAHIHGGELSQGAIDDTLRHSMTKLSHLHFVSTQEYAQRVIQLGEEPWRVILSGAPGLDSLDDIVLFDRPTLETKLGFELQDNLLLVTYHPVTLEYDQAGEQIDEVLGSLDRLRYPVVFTLPNADTGGLLIADRIRKYQKSHPEAVLVENLGTQNYFNLMKHSVALVGNSSSGIIEAPSFELPVVNIGSRQNGRVRAKNVIDVPCVAAEIETAVRKAVSTKFRVSLRGMSNPYRQVKSSEIIVNELKSVSLDKKLIVKVFHDFQPDFVG